MGALAHFAYYVTASPMWDDRYSFFGVFLAAISLASLVHWLPARSNAAFLIVLAVFCVNPWSVKTMFAHRYLHTHDYSAYRNEVLQALRRRPVTEPLVSASWEQIFDVVYFMREQRPWMLGTFPHRPFIFVYECQWSWSRTSKQPACNCSTMYEYPYRCTALRLFTLFRELRDPCCRFISTMF